MPLNAACLYWEQVIIAHADKDRIIDYLVGPLPASNRTTLRPRSENYHNPIPLNAHILLNWTMLGEQFARIIAPLDPVTRGLYNGSIVDGSLHFAGVAPTSYDGSWRRTWGQLRRTVPGSWLQPLDMYFHASLGFWLITRSADPAFRSTCRVQTRQSFTSCRSSTKDNSIGPPKTSSMPGAKEI